MAEQLGPVFTNFHVSSRQGAWIKVVSIRTISESLAALFLVLGSNVWRFLVVCLVNNGNVELGKIPNLAFEFDDWMHSSIILFNFRWGKTFHVHHCSSGVWSPVLILAFDEFPIILESEMMDELDRLVRQ